MGAGSNTRARIIGGMSFEQLLIEVFDHDLDADWSCLARAEVERRVDAQLARSATGDPGARAVLNYWMDLMERIEERCDEQQ
jgi:hypothetical protein